MIMHLMRTEWIQLIQVLLLSIQPQTLRRGGATTARTVMVSRIQVEIDLYYLKREQALLVVQEH